MDVTKIFNDSAFWKRIIENLIAVVFGQKTLANFDLSSFSNEFVSYTNTESETDVAAESAVDNGPQPQSNRPVQGRSAPRASAETGANLNPAHSHLVVWGDSIARGMGVVASKMGIGKVTNLGVDSAGFYSHIKPAAVENIPPNAKFLIQFGTNDVAGLIGKSDQEIANYAARVIGIAKTAGAQGASVTILGINNADKRDGKGNLVGYRGGDQRFWGDPENVRKWNETAERLNAAYEKQAKAGGFDYKATNNVVKPEMLSADGLHPNARGAQTMLGLGTGARA